MSIDKRFSDTEGYSDMLRVAVWSERMRGKATFFAQGEDGQAYVTVDIHEFKAWFDQAYAEVFGQPEGVAHVLITVDDDGSGWDTPRPLAVYTDAGEAVKARNEIRLAGGSPWISTAPVNPNVSDRKDQA